MWSRVFVAGNSPGIPQIIPQGVGLSLRARLIEPDKDLCSKTLSPPLLSV